MHPGWIVSIVLLALLPIVAFLSYYITKKLIEKQLRENPPITEQQIRAMFLSMGRKPSETQIKSVMNSMKKNSNSSNKYEKRK